MGNYVEAGSINDFEDGVLKEVDVQGKQILLVKIGDAYYAASNRCPHLGGNLAKGKLDGTVVTCPLHGSRFDLVDGRVIRWLKGEGMLSAIGKALKGPKSLAVYKVKVGGDKVFVEL